MEFLGIDLDLTAQYQKLKLMEFLLLMQDSVSPVTVCTDIQ